MERHTKRIKSLIDDALRKGAQTVLGGSGADVEDRFIEPTILKNMSEKMDIMNEEVFGPVVSLLTYKERIGGYRNY